MLSSKLPWELANPKWASELNPIISNPICGVVFLTNVSLVTGTNVINHGLGRVLRGWFFIDAQGDSSGIYRNANLNSTTLSLSSPRNVTVSIGVF